MEVEEPHNGEGGKYPLQKTLHLSVPYTYLLIRLVFLDR